MSELNRRAKFMRSISPFKGYDFNHKPRLSISRPLRDKKGNKFYMHQGIYTPRSDNVDNYIELTNMRTSQHKLVQKSKKVEKLKNLKVCPKVRMAP